MTGSRRAPLAFFSLLEECLHEPDEIICDQKDDILMFLVLENIRKLLEMLKVWTDAYVERTVPRMSDSFFADVFAAMFVANQTSCRHV